MINVLAVVLLLIGTAERKRFRAAEGSGAPPPDRAYRKYFIAAAILFGIFVVYVASQVDVDAGFVSCVEDLWHCMVREAAFGAILAVLLTVVWLIGKIRAERILRTVLALWLIVWVAVAAWLVRDVAVRYPREDFPQKKRHLQFCKKLIAAGKRDELAKFLRETDAECREWNAAFAAKFPESGGEK